MIERFAITDAGSLVFGIRFKPDNAVRRLWGTAEVVGYGRDAAAMETVIEEGLRKSAGAAKWTGKGRCIYRMRIRRAELGEALKQLRDSGFIIEQVTSLGRLIR